MVLRLIQQRLDDLDYPAQETEAETTRTVGLDGQWIELHLTAGHSKELDAVLAPYLEHGRKIQATDARRAAGKRAVSDRPGSKEAHGRDLAKVRQWGRDHGFKVSTHGKVPQVVLDQYEAIHA